MEEQRAANSLDGLASNPCRWKESVIAGNRILIARRLAVGRLAVKEGITYWGLGLATKDLGVTANDPPV